MGFSIKIENGHRENYNTIRELVQAEAPEVAEEALVAKSDSKLLDLGAPVPEAESLEILTFADEDGQEIYRHSTSHVMAEAVKRLFPEAKLAIGPAISEGFYYDFDCPTSFTPETLTRIEEEMKKIIAGDLPFERSEVDKAEAIKLFSEQGEKYKLELLEGIPEEEVSLYRDGDFVDLCQGPHLPSTGKIGSLKLLSVAGAYWRGDEKREMLQRIYGTSFPSQAELSDYLGRREEAAKRDHRKLGRELDLFSINEQVGPGLILWHPRGAVLRDIIETFWKQEHRKRGYQLVCTPHIGQIGLWETSGHTEFYRENMFFLEVEDRSYALKPMNCPFQMLIYKSRTRSYRDLPLRYAELGTVYRYERSGVLHGMLRVRGFTQDDAHIFCTPEQIKDEIGKVVEFAQYMLKAFGFPEYEVRLSTRPEKYTGEDTDWDRAEGVLAEVLKERDISYEIDPGEAVFYGPKIDIHLKDCLGRLHQGPTIQFDFNLPQRFDLTYVGPDSKEHPVVVVHRVVLGALERFVGTLIEQHGGAFPTWLAPVQVVVIPITERHHEYARQVMARLADGGFRAELDDRSETTGFKVREAELMKVPYMLIVGDREEEQGTVAVRKREQGDLGAVPLEEFAETLRKENSPPSS